jgi:hypothetical protein
VTGIAEWHTNADEPIVLDYNTEFKSLAQQALEVGTPYRAADHDALVIGLKLEPAPSLVNGDMELDDGDLLPDGWTGKGLSLLPGLDGQDCVTALGGTCSFRMVGSGVTKQLAQTVPSSGLAGDSFDVDYWAKTQGVRVSLLSPPRARLVFRAANGRTTAFQRILPIGTRDWTAYTLSAVAPHDYVSVRVEFVSQASLGTTWLDEVQLTRTIP